MMTPDEQHGGRSRTSEPALPTAGGSRWRRTRTAAVAALTSLFLTVGAAQALATPAGGDSAEEPNTPGTSATAAEWQDWSTDLFTQARGTDWAADSASRGCELISVDIVSTTVPEGTLDGAPAGLEVPMVDRVEDCTSGSDADSAAGVSLNSSAMAAASACRSISGPSTICLDRSGSYVVASFTYRGGGSTDGFLRVYERSSSSGCGTGTTLGTRSGTFSSGVTYSRSVYHPGRDHFSAAFWNETWWGHTNWGTVCDTL